MIGNTMIRLDKEFEYLLEQKYYLLKAQTSHTEYVTFDKNGKTTYLHRLVMEEYLGRELENFETVDHINKDGLDNRVQNLRVCTHAMNCANRKKPNIKNASSDFKGVSWHKAREKWHCRLMKNYKCYHIGYFDDEIECAKAYDAKAKEMFGEYASLNFPSI